MITLSIFITAIAAIFVFGLVIFIHELGHFAAAKAFNVKVNEFALGMGPKIISFTKGETAYSLRLLPIGGFVSMEGENDESDEPRSYYMLPKLKKAIILVAGAFMNLVLGLIVLTIMVNSDEYIASKTVSGFTEQNNSVQQSGLLVGDTITAVNGRRVFIANDIMYELARVEEQQADLSIIRDGENILIEDITFETMEFDDGYVQLVPGFTVEPIEKSIVSVTVESFAYTASLARLIFLSLVDLVTGRIPINNLSGPVGIVTVIGDAVSIGWEPLLMVLALLTVNLGVFNLLPVPALDGGRLFLLLIEAIARRPIPQKFELAINSISFVLLMGLMLFVTFNDVTRLFE